MSAPADILFPVLQDVLVEYLTPPGWMLASSIPVLLVFYPALYVASELRHVDSRRVSGTFILVQAVPTSFTLLQLRREIWISDNSRVGLANPQCETLRLYLSTPLPINLRFRWMQMKTAAVSCPMTTQRKKDDQKTQEVIANLAIANRISPDASLLSDLDGSNDTLCYLVP